MKRVSYIQNVIQELRLNAIWVGNSPYRAGLELFCGRGEMFTCRVAALANSFFGIDIDSTCRNNFLANIPGSKFLEGDSVKLEALCNLTWRNFDLVSIDNPLGCFGSYCEHFEALEQLPRLVASRSCVVFNVVTQPYNYNDPHLLPWLERRRAYYGHVDPVDISTVFLTTFYRKKLEEMGLSVDDIRIICRETNESVPYFHSVIARVIHT